MRYLKKFNESESVSIFNGEWGKFIPSSLTIVTNNGEFTLERKTEMSNLETPIDVSNIMNVLQISYFQNTVEDKDGDVNADGEPDCLEFDITLVKDNNGNHQNPDTLRLNVEMTYGDSMTGHFTIDKPNKVDVVHYTGKNSLYDPETYFGFTDESLSELVEFFNRFGFTTTPEDFTFIDKDLDSYEYKKELPEGDIEQMSLSDQPEVEDLKGGNRIISYKKFKK